MEAASFPSELRASLCSALPIWVSDVFTRQADVRAKGNDGLDLVTSLDFEMQAKLERELQALLPGSTVVGEEDYKPHSNSGPVWLVDPLDGTVNFVANLPVFSVAVILLIDGVPILAAVHDIPHGDTYSAQKGNGAFLNGTSLMPHSHKANLAIVSSGLIRDLSETCPEVLGELLSQHKLRNFGSQALHLCYAASGKVCLVASREAKAWDDMAGALIANEAGLQYGSYQTQSEAAAFDQDQRSLCCAPELFHTYQSLFARSLPVLD